MAKIAKKVSIYSCMHARETKKNMMMLIYLYIFKKWNQLIINPKVDCPVSFGENNQVVSRVVATS